MKIARERYNPYVVLIEDAQTDIREIVRRAFLTREPKERTEAKLKKVIHEVVKNIEIPQLKRDVAAALIKFANAQRKAWLAIGLSPETMWFLASEKNRKNPRKPRPGRVFDELIAAGNEVVPDADKTQDYGNTRTYENVFARGVPLGRYYEEVWKSRVVPVMEKAAGETALDPTDYTGRNSLRNLAEMEVRYHDHLNNIAELKDSGVKLVVCSSHADCSGRCAPWQGRVYSLDGTAGTVDGHRYVPLETATDVWYTTKAGRRYKNGLLGFNCRHRLEPYTGKLLPTVSAAERKAEYSVTMKQRRLERAVRFAKVNAAMNKGLDTEAYKQWTERARRANAEYLAYCKANGRAAYPARTAIN